MGEGEDVAIREEEAWLLESRINPSPISGTLELAGGRISFALDREAAGAKLDWLERTLGIHNLDERLAAGEPVVAFDYGLDECSVSWPLTGGGAVMCVQAFERKWVVTYDDPGVVGTRFSQPFAMSSGRGRAKEWKQALARAEPSHGTRRRFV
jgi:hypothetical protein